jgi:hypothetical protein
MFTGTCGRGKRRLTDCPFGNSQDGKIIYTESQMSDRIVCSCITCPKCGTWVVVEREMTRETNKEKLNTTCPGPECGKQFAFAAGETKVFELPMSLFERRHFYRSELS